MEKWDNPEWVANFIARAKAAGYADEEILAHVAAKTAEARSAGLNEVAEDKPSRLSVWRPALQGATFRFGDELAGAGAALIPGGRGYREARDNFRAEESRTREAYPIMSGAAEFAGGLAVPGLGAAKSLGTGLRAGTGLLRAGAQGAALGGAAGALSAAGDAPELSDVPGAIPGGAVVGSLLGGAAGAALRPLAVAFGGLGKLAQDVFSPDAAVARRTRELVTKALADAGLAPEDAMRALQELERIAPGQSMLADVSPRLGRELRTSVNTAPALEAPLAQRLTQRQAGQAGRLARGLESEMGVTAAGAREAQRQTGASMRTLADRLYAPLENQPLGTPAIARQLMDPDVSKLATRHIPSADGMTFGRGQRLYQDMVDEAGSAFASGRGNAGSFWRDQANRLRQNIDEAAPGFARANAEYGTAATIKGAFASGQKAVTASADEVVDEISRLMSRGGTEAVDAYRMGFVRKLATQLRRKTTNRDVSTAIAEMGEDTQAVFRVLFPDEGSYRAFMARAGAERAFVATNRAARGNSSTTQQLMDASSNAAASTMQAARSGGVGPALATAAAHGGRALIGDVNERARTNVGRLLMQGPNSDPLQAFLRDLSRPNRFNLLGRAAQAAVPVATGESLFDIFGQ